MTGHPLHTDWSLAGTAGRRTRYYAASQQKFVPFKDPLVFTKGSMQYLWDSEGKKYTDLLGMNVCVSVGHAHPTVVKAAMEQAQALTHCTTMFYHPVPAHFAEELAATMPKGQDWVVHFTNSGSEAIDLAMVIRSIVVDEAGSTVGTGGGITALSDPGEELAEARLKAAALLRVLGVR